MYDENKANTMEEGERTACGRMKWKIRRKKPASIRVQLVVITSVMLMGMALILLYSSLRFYRIQYETVKENQQMVAEQAAAKATQNCKDIKKMVQAVAYNKVVQDYLRETDREHMFEQYQSVKNFLNNTVNLGKGILDIAVVGEKGAFINIDGESLSAKQLAAGMPGGFSFSGLASYRFRGVPRDCIIAGMPFYSAADIGNKHKIGTVLFVLDPGRLVDGYAADSSEKPNLLFMDRDYRLLSGDTERYKAVRELDLERMARRDNTSLEQDGILLTCYRIEEMDGYAVSWVDCDRLAAQILTLTVQQSVLALAVFVLLGALLVVRVGKVFRSLEQLMGVMQRVNAGNRRALRERIPVTDSCSEIAAVGQAFNTMLDEISTLAHNISDSYGRMYELEVARRKTELAFLQSQINPHFLYNTLELICGMSAAGDNETVVEVTRALGRTFRYSIKGGDLVTLRQELDIAKSYVMIQQARFEGRFTVEYRVDAGCLNARVPKMILQPLVENAIYHGLERKLEKGHLQVGARQEGDRLCITVADDGVGITQDRLAVIRHMLRCKAEERNRAFDSIGLVNVNARIRLYYGEPYGLAVESEESRSTTVRLWLPLVYPGIEDEQNSITGERGTPDV